MDDIVLRGMARWPDVPAVYGWLGLDRRGQWLIRGERIANPIVSAFIGRNYGHDAGGCWFFQNGPQRVFVALDYTPFVYRIVGAEGAPLALGAHNGAAVTTMSGAWIDENGATLIDTEHGVGLIHDHDLECLLPCFSGNAGGQLTEDALARQMDLVAQGRPADIALKFGGALLKLASIAARDVPQRFGFIAHPAPPAGHEACA
jgi:hypothetical protein